jgi:hypothetical protein
VLRDPAELEKRLAQDIGEIIGVRIAFQCASIGRFAQDLLNPSQVGIGLSGLASRLPEDLPGL